MKYALIGCGRIAVNHFCAALENGLEIVGLCDIVPERIGEMLAKAGRGPAEFRQYVDYREMLEAEKPELVAIATESGKHAAIALDCIEAGCHIIIEKPMAMSVADADAIIAAGERKGVCVCACHQNRFNESVQAIRRALEAGRFGRMFYGTAHVRWNRGREYYEQAPWRGTWAQDGGALMNQCIHNIDLLCWMLGDEVSEVFAYTDNKNHPYIEAEDLGIALVRLKNGSYGVIEGTTDIYPRNLEETLYLFGEKGTVKAGGKSVNLIEEWVFADGLDDSEAVKRESHEDPPNVYGFGHAKLYADVMDAILSGRRPLVDGAAGKRVVELVLAIYQSAATGQPVCLPLGDVASTDFVGQFGGG